MSSGLLYAVKLSLGEEPLLNRRLVLSAAGLMKFHRAMLVASALCLLSILCSAADQLPLQDARDRSKTHRVGIIGGGHAGLSAAYYLDKFVAPTDHTIQTTIYERNLGAGRNTPLFGPWDVQNGPDTLPTVGLGAHVFTKADRIMMELVREFNMTDNITPARWGKDAQLELNTSGYGDNRQHRIGIWDADGFSLNQDFEEAYLDEWWADSSLRSRYHDAPARVQKMLEQRITNFTKLYEAPIFPFKNYSSAMISSGLNASIALSASEYFAASSIDPAFIQDIVASSAQSTYGRAAAHLNGLGGHGLAALSSLATQDSMRGSVPNKVPNCSEEPNGECDLKLPTVLDNLFMRQVWKGLYATEYLTEVDSIRRLENGSWFLTSYDIWLVKDTAVFDEIILAAPYWSSEVVFDPPLPAVPYQRYEPLHVTVLTSPHLVSPSFFGLAADAQVPDEILTRAAKDDNRSADQQKAVDFSRIIRRGTILSAPSNYTQRENLYEILTPNPVNGHFLRDLFDLPKANQTQENRNKAACDTDINRFWHISCKDISWLATAEWSEPMVYPVFEPFASAEELDMRAPIKFTDGLWYTSGMELIESRMEAMMLSGKNVARLMVDEWLEADG